MNWRDAPVTPGQVHVFTDGRKPPRGRGLWAFGPLRYTSLEDDVFWSEGSYAQAKRAARWHYAARGVRNVWVVRHFYTTIQLLDNSGSSLLGRGYRGKIPVGARGRVMAERADGFLVKFPGYGGYRHVDREHARILPGFVPPRSGE